MLERTAAGTVSGARRGEGAAGGGGRRSPAARWVAAALALLAALGLLAFVSIFLKNGAFFRMSGSTMKRTWLPRRKQLQTRCARGGESATWP